MTYRSEADRAYHAAYRAAHRAERAARSRAYRAADVEGYNARRRALYAAEPAKARAAAKRYRENNHERVLERKRARHPVQRLKRYAMSAEEFRALLVGQAGVCLLCLRVPERDLVIDHDHVTGAVRGLLCNPCNKMLGFARDDAERLARAASYLNRAAAA